MLILKEVLFHNDSIIICNSKLEQDAFRRSPFLCMFTIILCRCGIPCQKYAMIILLLWSLLSTCYPSYIVKVNFLQCATYTKYARTPYPLLVPKVIIITKSFIFMKVPRYFNAGKIQIIIVKIPKSVS